MPNEPYKDVIWLRKHYVSDRRKLTDIQKILHDQYAVDVTVQTLYNWCKKFDLLKFRGKGRNLKRGTKKMPKSPMQIRVEKERRQRQRMNKIAKNSRRPK